MSSNIMQVFFLLFNFLYQKPVGFMLKNCEFVFVIIEYLKREVRCIKLPLIPVDRKTLFNPHILFSQNLYAAIFPKGVPLVKTKQLCRNRIWIKEKNRMS